MIGNEPSRDFLLKYLESRAWYAAVAAHALAELQDRRGAAALLKIMLDPADRQLGSIAGRLAAEFGAAAIDGLCDSASHPDVEIRRRAFVGLGDLCDSRPLKPEGRRAAEVLAERLAIEPDSQLRNHIEITLKIIPPAGGKRLGGVGIERKTGDPKS